jgi:hypothetical protein
MTIDAAATSLTSYLFSLSPLPPISPENRFQTYEQVKRAQLLRAEINEVLTLEGPPPSLPPVSIKGCGRIVAVGAGVVRCRGMNQLKLAAFHYCRLLLLILSYFAPPLFRVSLPLFYHFTICFPSCLLQHLVLYR